VSAGAFTEYVFENVTTNHTITASFAIDTHTITTSAGSNGSITPTQTVNYGGSTTITITPDSHYHIADVLVDGTSVGAVTSYTFTNVTNRHSISATFTLDTNSITATVSPSYGGTIFPSGVTAVSYNTDQVFVISPKADYRIVDVIIDGESIGARTSYTFSGVTTPHTIEATFASNTTHIIRATGGDFSTIGPNGNVVVNDGADQTFTISTEAEGGCSISNVYVDGVPQGPITSYTFQNVTADHTISVTSINDAAATPIQVVAPIESKNTEYAQKRAANQPNGGMTSRALVTPAVSSVAGGAKVTIELGNFTSPPTTVKLGGVEAKILSATTSRVVIQSPPNRAGRVDINLSNTKQSLTIPKAFTYRVK